MRTSISSVVVFVLLACAAAFAGCGPKQPTQTPGGMPGMDPGDAGASSAPQDQTPAAGTNKQGLQPQQ